MITSEQILNANKSIKTTPIKGKDYAEVSERIKAFRSICPNGSIQTDIVSLENGVVTMKSTVLDEEGKVLATGMAQEKESNGYINKTSFIENCETSSVGRALGMCGLGVDMSVASALEVANAINNQDDSKQQNKPKKQNSKTDEQKNQEMIDSVNQDLIPKGQIITPEQIANIQKEIDRTGIPLKSVLDIAKVDDLSKMNDTTYTAIMNKFAKTANKAPDKAVENG